jgi:(p)ppGpp synthase/HD superfamily hydrolase
MTNIGGQRNVALAEAVARWAHTGQVDKNGYDYIDHPKAVFYRIYADDAEDFDGQIVAWLHDTVEDTSITLGQLYAFFPAYIVQAVKAISFRVEWTNETRDEYYARVKANPIALRVKLHDIAHNTSPKRMDKLDAETRERLTKKYAHALEVLKA